VTVENHTSYIKIEILRGKNPTEFHSALCEVCGEQTVDRSTVCGEQTVDRSTVCGEQTVDRSTVCGEQTVGRRTVCGEQTVDRSTVCGEQTVDRSTVCGEQTVDRSTVCGEQTVDHSTVSRWPTRFREGRVTINDDPRPGRPKTSTDERSVKLVAEFLAEDRRETYELMSQATGISPTSVFRILTNDLQKRKICARWVPRCLTAEQIYIYTTDISIQNLCGVPKKMFMYFTLSDYLYT
jgi:predicted RNA-binding Zn-ribbon protein involved in translation (DUF1610 family)